eukprot:CAMPEP_0197852684 /NCGR_PEP_ID=MMETSP1438-20131217/21204_1 /TAXON_ID=1461541 /ORGANISM="Pterosperma sp., Strain CCMP1384" /LENGTH=209 /DNA_ID=CAMNT_0043466845 /DNA_START=147 /DNA_END=773 /DNA_ORIENTATION=+
MVAKSLHLIAAVGLAGLITAQAHLVGLNGVTCGKQFSTPQTALLLPSNGLYGFERVVTCDGPVVWVNISVTAPIELELTAGGLHPISSQATSERFKDQTADMVVLADSLPPVDQSLVEAPLHGASNGLLLRGADDISTCDHSENLDPFGLVVAVPMPGGRRCGFLDQFGTGGRLYGSVLVDKKVKISEAGMVSIGFWIRGLQTGKMWVM